MDYFTGDEHHDHLNKKATGIIDYCKRPFKNIMQNSKVIIERHNDTVKEEDTVIHVGDFCMRGNSHLTYYESLMKRYRPVKYRHLILGNHDYMDPFKYHEIGFTSVHTVYWFEEMGFKFLVAHDPSFYQPAVYDKIMICGHIHNLFKVIPDRKIVNVGVDVWDFTPVSLEQIITILNLKK
jgi:calcineurin-like phosphoesterase family protein